MEGKYEKLEKIKKLRDEGVLTYEEFEREKQRILDGPEAEPPPLYVSNETQAEPPAFKPWGMEENAFCMLLHLSQFSGYVIPFAGLIMPIVMWVTQKDESQKIDLHGRIVINWIISFVIYLIFFFLLATFVIGIPLLFALLLCAIIFPIIGGVKANDGKVWRYPMSINFFSLYDIDDF